jgi:hypothetical protein
MKVKKMLDWIIALSILFFSLIFMYLIIPKFLSNFSIESMFIRIIVSFIGFVAIFSVAVFSFVAFLYTLIMGHEWVAGKVADLLGVSHYSMSDEQGAFESNLIEIKDMYSDEDNGFQRSKAVRMYDQYNAKFGDSGIQIVDRICRIDYINEDLLKCLALQTSINIEYQMSNYRAFDKFKFEPGDKIFFCGLMTKESSFTYAGGIDQPEFTIKDAFVYERQGGCKR